MRKQFIISSIKIIFNHPKLFLNLLTFDFHKIYCSYFQFQLQQTQKIYKSFSEKLNSSSFHNSDELIENLTFIEHEIIKQFGRNNAYYFTLYYLVRTLRPKIVVETGVHRGVSSLFILQALVDNGEKDNMLYSIDLPLSKYNVEKGDQTQSFLAPDKVGVCVLKHLMSRWITILGDSKKELPILMNKLGKESVGVFLHDSKHTYEHMMWEFETMWPYIQNNQGVLISDDINWNDSFGDFIKNNKCKNHVMLKKDSVTSGTFGVISKN